MKTRKLEYTKHGYSYLKCNKNDCFDWGGLAICDYCGKPMMNDVYLIYILGSAYCTKCFEDWLSKSKKYSEDLQLQKNNHEKWYEYHGFKIIKEENK